MHYSRGDFSRGGFNRGSGFNRGTRGGGFSNGRSRGGFRGRGGSNVICNFCQRPGHTAEKCYNNPMNQNNMNQSFNPGQSNSPNSFQQPNAFNQLNSNPGFMNQNQPLVCTFCGKVGHDASRCFKNPQNPNNKLGMMSNQKGFQKERVECKFCLKPGHTIENCRQLNKNQNQNQICSFCSQPGHSFENCNMRMAQLNVNAKPNLLSSQNNNLFQNMSPFIGSQNQTYNFPSTMSISNVLSEKINGNTLTSFTSFFNSIYNFLYQYHYLYLTSQRPRSHHTISSTIQGLIVIGGKFSSIASNTLDCFILSNPQESWKNLMASQLLHFYGHTASILLNKLIIVGGSFTNGKLNDQVFTLDLQTAQWSSLSAISPNINKITPTPRAFHSAAVIDQNLFIFGGVDINRPLNDLWVFNAMNGNWSKVECNGNIPSPRGSHSMIVYQNHIIIFGGSDGSQCFNDVYSLNTANMQWTALFVPSNNIPMNSYPAPRIGHISWNMGPFLCVYGGQDLETNRLFSELWSLNLITLQWQNLNISEGLIDGISFASLDVVAQNIQNQGGTYQCQYQLAIMGGITQSTQLSNTTTLLNIQLMG